MDLIGGVQLGAQLDALPNPAQAFYSADNSSSNPFATAPSSVSPQSSSEHSQHQQDYHQYQHHPQPPSQQQQSRTQQQQYHQPAQAQSFYLQQGDPSSFASPSFNSAGENQSTDRQWANIMAASDAQLWAGAAWEGFDFDMTNGTSNSGGAYATQSSSAATS